MIQTLNFIPDFFYQIFNYREYLKQSVLRDLRTKYKRSVLGYFWTMIHPLAMMAVLAVVFANMMKMPTKDYAVFLFCGLLPWNFFSSTVMMSLGSIRNNASLFRQVPLPKYVFVLSIAASNLFNFVVALVPLLVLTLLLGRPIPMTIFAFPMVFFPIFCVTVGVALILAASNVFFEDTLHLTEVAMSALYFLCPILYYRTLIPQELLKYLILNPLFCQLEFMRDIFYDGVLPDMTTYSINLVGSVIVLVIGLWIFKRSEDKFLYFV